MNRSDLRKLMTQAFRKPKSGTTHKRSSPLNRAIEQLEDRLTPNAPVNPSFESGLTGWTLTGSESPAGIGSSVTAVAGGTSGSQQAQLNVPSQSRAPNGWTGLTQFLRSSDFTMVNGEQIFVDWRVTNNGDNAIGVGQLLRTSDNVVISTFFNVNTGPSTSYATASFNTSVADTYYVQFQGGTFDSTFGGFAGAFLNVDNIRTIIPAPMIVYVDPSFTSTGANLDGDLTAGGNQAATVGYNAFSTISTAMAAVASNGTVIVNTASYTENPTLGIPLTEFRTYGATVNGSLTANVAIGVANGISFTGTGITVTGTTNLTAGTGGVALTNANNDFQGVFNASSSGTVSVTSKGTMTIGTVAAAGQTVGINAIGSILDDLNQSTRITANAVNLNAGIDIGAKLSTATEDIDVTAVTITGVSANSPASSLPGIWIDNNGTTTNWSNVVTTNGVVVLTSTSTATTATNVVAAGTNRNASITERTGSLTVNTVSATGRASLTATLGSILDGNAAANNITAASAAISAVAGGVATAADPLETTVANLEGAAGNGFFVANSSDLTIGGVIGALNGITATGGNVSVMVTGQAILNEPVTAPAGSVSVVTTVGSTSGFTGPYQLQNWNSGGISGGSTSITPPSGASATAQFGYNVNLGGGGVSFRTATFSTTAATSGPVSFTWNYAGYHAFFQTNATFQVFANGPGGTTNTLFSGSVGGGFNVSGSASINVATGFTYGYTIGGKNSDSDSRLIGTLTLSNFSTPSSTSPDILINSTVSAAGPVGLTSGGGSITETGAGLVSTPATLTTNSATGQTLNGANTVGTFNATNTTSGNISFTNTAANFTISEVSETGGSVTVNNTGSTTVAGTGVTATGAIAVTTTQNLTVDQPVNSTGAQPVTMTFGQSNAGSTATLNAAITGTPAKLVGGTGSDTFDINTTGSNLVVIGGGVPAAGTDTVSINVFGINGYVILTDPASGVENYVVNVSTAFGESQSTFDVNNAASGNQAVTVSGTKVLTYQNTTNTISNLNLNGGFIGDTYNVQYGNPTDFPGAPTSLIPQRVNIVAGGGTDMANTTGSSIADTVDVNFTKARWVTRNTENVTYTSNLETLNVFVQASDDAVYAKPDTATAINLSGAAPIAPSLPGDFLQLSVVGVTNPVVSSPAIPDGQVSSSSHKTLTWTSFETVPVPLGLGGTFDFGPTGQQVQTLPAPSKQFLFIPVGPNDTLGTNANGYGWNAPVNAFDRTASDPWGTPSGPASKLLQDGAWGAASPAGGDRNFFVAVAPNQPVQVSLFVGDQYAAWATMDVYFDNAKVGSVTPTAAGKFTRFVANYTPTGTAMTISVRQPLSTTYWVFNGLDVRPVSLVAPLTITRNDDALGSVAKLSDGLTQDVYDVVGAQPNEVVTIDPTFGTLVGVDADLALNGFQVVADGTGKASFTLQRPTGNGNNTINVTGAFNQSSTAKLFGGSTASGDFVQTYGLPTVRRLDFDSVSSPATTAVGYVGIGSSQVYISAAGNALGWVGGPATSFDRGGAFSSLVRDGNVGTTSTPGDFHLDLATAGDYYVTVTLGDPAYTRDFMNVAVVPGFGTLVADPDVTLTNPTNLSGANGQSNTVTVHVTTNATGQLRLRFTNTGGFGYWSVQTLEVRPVANRATHGLTLLSPATVNADGTTLATYQLTGVTPSSLVTIGTQFGVVDSYSNGKSFVPDASVGAGGYVGFQAVSDGTGKVQFRVKSPQSPSDITGKVWATELTGLGASSLSQLYVGVGTGGPATAQRFDFDSGASPTATGFTGVRGTDLFNAVSGFGWKSAVGDYDRGAAAGTTTPDLFRDATWGYGYTGVFQVAVTPGAAMKARVYVGDSYAGWPGITILAEGGTPVTLNPNVNQYLNAVVNGTDVNNDGKFDISIYNPVSGVWVLCGLDVTTAAGTLPAPTV